MAYYDKNSQRQHEDAAQYGGKVYDSYFDLLKDPEIDAVSVCVENRSHAEMTTAALYAGKHVLCEKPMAVTLAECESMVAAGGVQQQASDDRPQYALRSGASPGQGAAGAGGHR